MFVVGYSWQVTPKRLPLVSFRILHQRIPRDSSGVDVTLHEGIWTKYQTQRRYLKVRICLGRYVGAIENNVRVDGSGLPREDGRLMTWYLKSGLPGGNDEAVIHINHWWFPLFRTEAMKYLATTCKNSITEEDVFIPYKTVHDLQRATY
jgi:hypothetical protein